jgi:PhnB protein
MMEFYKGIFGGELSLMTYGDAPGTDPANKDRIMHGKLEGGALHLMGSDGDPAKISAGSRIELTLSGMDETKLREYFGSLSAGGKVKYPLDKMFWGDTFGTLTDKFGIDWQVNITAPK